MHTNNALVNRSINALPDKTFCPCNHQNKHQFVWSMCPLPVVLINSPRCKCQAHMTEQEYLRWLQPWNNRPAGLTVHAMVYHIKAKTKWPIFCKWHFQMHFLGTKCLYFHSNFTKVCCQGYSWQYVNIGLSNDLAPNKWQAVIWINDDAIHWYVYGSSILSELTHLPLMLHICIGELGWCWFR